MKFGGTSVQDAEAFSRVASIVTGEKENSPVVVVSAMSKMTDALLGAFETAKKGDFEAGFASLGEHFDRHARVAAELLSEDRQKAFSHELELSKKELVELLERASRRSLPLAMLKDAIVSYGEQLSSRLLAEVFKAKGLNARQMDSRRLIVTDDEYGAAIPIWDETEKLIQLELQPLIDAGEIPIMGGFIAGEQKRRNDHARARRFGLFGGAGRRGLARRRDPDLDGCDRRADDRSAHRPGRAYAARSVL